MTIPKFLLGNLCNFTQGIQIPASETIKSKTKGYIRYLYIRDFFTDKFQVFVENKYPNKILSTNDIVMVNTGATAGVVYRGKEGVLCNNAFKIHIKVNQKNRLDREYLWHYLNSEEKDRLLKKLFNNAGQPHVGHGNVARLMIPLPPLPEQRKIAEILSTWDEAIAKTEQLIEALRQRKKGLMQRLLTGQVRFPGFVGEWKTERLGVYAKVRRGASPRPISNPDYFSKQGRGWIRISDITSEGSRFLNKTTQYLSNLGESKSVKVEIGDLIMSICATIGVPKIVNIPACIHDGFVLFSDFEETFLKEFLFHFIDFITSRLASGGQPGTQKNLNTEIVRKIKVPIISLAEQKRIADILNMCDEEIIQLTNKLELLKNQKKGLMQRLLTGQVRVNV